MVRGGVRADAQTAGGVLFSPRLSAVANTRGFILRAGSGMFVKPWTNAIFLHMLENDGNHLHQYQTTDASFSGLATGTTTPQSEILAKILPNLVPIRNWMSRISVEHPFKNFSPGIEYTWTDGTHLLGSQRLSAPVGSSAGWIDWLGSNRCWGSPWPLHSVDPTNFPSAIFAGGSLWLLKLLVCAGDERHGQAKAAAQFFFARGHCAVVGFVVIPSQMQQPMQ